MKIMKKLVSAVLSGMMLCAAAASVPTVTVSAEEQIPTDTLIPMEQVPNYYLILGDSISTGYGLEYHSLSYAKQLNSPVMKSWASDGTTTAQLLETLNDDSVKVDIKRSSNIIISIGGNDLLQPVLAYVEGNRQEGESLLQTLKRLASSKGADVVLGEVTKALRAPKNQAKANIAAIAATLTELNPNAKIVFQTLYNPFEVPESMVTERGFSMKDFNLLTNYINGNEGILNEAMKAQEESYENVLVADVGAAFAGTGWLYTRVLDSDVHPSALGHALIAATVMKTIGAAANSSVGIYHTLDTTPDSVFTQVPEDDMALMCRYEKVPAAYALGDVNGDGKVNAVDSRLALVEYTYGFIGLDGVLDSTEKAAADINKDEKIALFDSHAILKYYTYLVLAKEEITWDEILTKKK
ncbi:MAG: hypothetical protein K5705_06335 [Oscillospiraceae bacterium]|nr:hypothetical protein [Oscillospiraceae bacterium]